MPEQQLAPEDVETLQELYSNGGALAHLFPASTSQMDTWLTAGLTAVVDTPMGAVLVTTASGRKRVFGTVDDTTSIGRSLDTLYQILCLEQLNWARVEHSDDLVGLSRWNEFTAVRIPDRAVAGVSGLAYVMGQVTGRGISPEAIRRLGKKLKSIALSQDLTVILLTPHPRRGQLAAQQFRSFMRLVTINPRADGLNTTERGASIPERPADITVDPGPYLTPAMAHALRNKLPARTLRLLQLPRSTRVAEARRAINCDWVMTEQQLARHYGLDRYDLAGYWGVRALIRPVHGRLGLEVPTHFVCAGASHSRVKDGVLAHLAGVAETRLLLNIPPTDAWIVEPGERCHQAKPDAIYHTAAGAFAIEYDNGSYDERTRSRKLTAFQTAGFAKIVWSSPHQARRATLEQVANLRVVVVQWWRGDALTEFLR